jgi:succinyl-diaminopimelate desuccinylase
LLSNGEPAHGSKPWLGVDANENIIRTVTNLRKIFTYYSKDEIPEDEWVTTMHVATIHGGKAYNVVADYAEAVLDIRFTEDYTFNSLVDIIKNNAIGVKVVKLMEANLIFNEPTNKYLQLYKSILEKNIEEKVTFNYATSSSDARYFVRSDTTVLSAKCDSGDIHGDGEWLNIEKIKTFARLRCEFLDALASGGI